MSEIETENESINEEIQLISSIYEEGCQISLDGEYVTYKMTVTPQTAGDVSMQYSIFDVEVRCKISEPDSYPEKAGAEFLILKSAGLTDETRKQLAGVGTFLYNL